MRRPAALGTPKRDAEERTNLLLLSLLEKNEKLIFRRKLVIIRVIKVKRFTYFTLKGDALHPLTRKNEALYFHPGR